jgi:adenylate cyclase
VGKVKTIGDSYVAAGGLDDLESNKAVETVAAAKEMLIYLHDRNKKAELKWYMRLGIHSGPVVGGVIGTEKLSFDLWGETVNIASRIEGTSKPDKINISAKTYDLVKNHYECEYRGKIKTKDGDLQDMYFVT